MTARARLGANVRAIGRPPRIEGEPTTVCARVRLTAEELQRWHREASARGLSLSAWLRELVSAKLSGLD